MRPAVSVRRPPRATPPDHPGGHLATFPTVHQREIPHFSAEPSHLPPGEAPRRSRGGAALPQLGGAVATTSALFSPAKRHSHQVPVSGRIDIVGDGRGGGASDLLEDLLEDLLKVGSSLTRRPAVRLSKATVMATDVELTPSRWSTAIERRRRGPTRARSRAAGTGGTGSPEPPAVGLFALTSVALRHAAGALNGSGGGKAHRGNISAIARACSRSRSAPARKASTNAR